MSALAGIWHFDHKPDANEMCSRQLAVQSIYGPHATSLWDGGDIALGRCLFRILPEDVYDHQPLVGGGGRYTLVADLRLDNRDELFGELQIPLERARTLCDAAILLSAWERWQEACFDHLVGDYAFAVWDRTEQRLVLARDPLGQRPLHYHRGPTFVAFASMPKGLHTLSEIPRLPDEERIAEFLALLPEAGSQTFFQGVERVEAGHFVVVKKAGITARRHWDPPRKTITLASSEDYAEALRHHFDTAVRSHLRGANGAVGAHLSAGFDSSSVAATAARLLAPSGGKVIGFTSVPRDGYDGPSPRGRIGDEGPLAARTAALYPNMEHVLIRAGLRSPVDSLDRYFYLYERPVLNLCNATWMDAINDAARARKINVLLTGQMGNMTISYDGLTLLPQLMRRGRWLKWLREGAALVRHEHWRWRGVMVTTFGPYMPLPLWIWLNKTLKGKAVGLESYSALRRGRLSERDLAARARARALDLHYRPRKDGFETRLWVLRRLDLGSHFKGILGGWGIDQRDPTADRRLIEFCLAIPEDQFLKDGQTKALVRRAFADRLPPEVIAAREKGYQALDWHEGFAAARSNLREEITRLGGCDAATAAIDVERLEQLVNNWPENGWETETVYCAYRVVLLRAVSTGHFLRRASGSNA